MWRRRQARQRRGRCGSGPYPLAAEDPGRFDQRQVGERLREVADLPAAGDVVLLGVQAQVVTQGEQPLEQLPRLGLAAVERERLDQPERAGKELALAAELAADTSPGMPSAFTTRRVRAVSPGRVAAPEASLR